MLSNFVVTGIPPKIQAALEFLRFCQDKETPIPPYDGYNCASRDLSKVERLTYDAALEVVRNYFTGEINFEPFYSGVSSDTPEDPNSPVVVR